MRVKFLFKSANSQSNARAKCRLTEAQTQKLSGAQIDQLKGVVDQKTVKIY